MIFLCPSNPVSDSDSLVPAKSSSKNSASLVIMPDIINIYKGVMFTIPFTLVRLGVVDLAYDLGRW